MLFTGPFKNFISQIDKFEWNLWVYTEPFSELTEGTKCLVIDVDNADLGADGFTPLEAEQLGYNELISVQDIRGVFENLKKRGITLTQENVISAIKYFIDNDAYIAVVPSKSMKSLGSDSID